LQTVKQWIAWICYWIGDIAYNISEIIPVPDDADWEQYPTGYLQHTQAWFIDEYQMWMHRADRLDNGDIWGCTISEMEEEFSADGDLHI